MLNNRLFIAVAKPPLVAFGFLPALVLRLCRVRILLINVGRVGHLALEPDCYIKEERLGLHPRYRAWICAPVGEVANPRLAEYWGRSVRIIRSRILCLILRVIALNKFVRYNISNYTVTHNDTQTFSLIQSRWDRRPPVLSLSPEDAERGSERLIALGVPAGAWFVCVHSRDAGYSPQDEHLHCFRNVDMTDYRLAIEAIVGKGGWCVRIGDPAMKHLPPMENVIDYAHHPLKADWMDLFLCARCRFFLGSPSGAYFMASVFGVPVANANMIPVSSVLPYGANDIGIPKLLWWTQARRLITFPEIFSSPKANWRHAADYRAAGIEMIANTPEEILDLALEQLERTEGVAMYSTTDEELQTRFKSLIRPGQYGYGSPSRIGRAFLREHAALLQAPASSSECLIPSGVDAT